MDISAFDPGETAGEYELDLRESYGRTVLVKLIRTALQCKGNFARIRIGQKVLSYSIRLDQDGMQGNVESDGSIDVKDWHIQTNRGYKLPVAEINDDGGHPIPLECSWAQVLKQNIENLSLKIKFSYSSLKKRANASDALSEKSFLVLFDGFSNTSEAKHCLDLIDTIMGPDVFIMLEQAKELFDCLNCPSDVVRFREMSSVRTYWLNKCYHRIVETGRNKEILDWVTEVECEKLKKLLGAVSFSFTPNNPTGYHRLDLSDRSQREIACRLAEIRNDTEPRIEQLNKFYSSGRRAGGKRETADQHMDLERAWRNGKLNGNPMRWTADWALPHHGILAVDFVEVTKPDPNDKKDGEMPVMKDNGPFAEGQVVKRDFSAFITELESEEDQTQRVHKIRQYSNVGFFMVRQLAQLLKVVDSPSLKVEIAVIGYARSVDWHGYKNLMMNLSIPEVKMLEHRIGYINIFDDVMAVDYYELDLSRPSQRWVMQELIHLAAIEPGNNVVECTIEGIDFEPPASWLKNVPKKGHVSFYYCREQKVIEECFVKGSWDGIAVPSPWFVREDGTHFGNESW